MNTKKLGQLLKHVRTNQKLSLEALSTLSTVSIPFLSMLENDKGGMPNLTTLSKICESLQIPLILLLNMSYLEELKAVDTISAKRSESIFTNKYGEFNYDDKGLLQSQ